MTNFREQDDWRSYRAGFSVYALVSGGLIYSNEDIRLNRRRLLSISNDGNILCLFSDFDADGSGGIYILREGVVSAIINPSKWPHEIDAYMTPDGDYLIAGGPSCVKVFKIKK